VQDGDPFDMEGLITMSCGDAESPPGTQGGMACFLQPPA